MTRFRVIFDNFGFALIYTNNGEWRYAFAINGTHPTYNNKAEVRRLKWEIIKGWIPEEQWKEGKAKNESTPEAAPANPAP